MNSQSEISPTDNVAAVPVPLLGREPHRRKALRLQFHTLGQSKESPNDELEVCATGDGAHLQAEIVVLHAKLAEQAEAAAVRLEDAKRDAVLSAREEWEAELDQLIEEERSRVSLVCEEFHQERARYFLDVEAEVVKLALAIAARVLHRETKFDPLLLSAAVRVALEKVATQSGVVLRVPKKDAVAWLDTLGEGVAVQLIGDEELHAGECVLETKSGKVDLGVSAQLAEIERGFFDLLQKRPA